MTSLAHHSFSICIYGVWFVRHLYRPGSVTPSAEFGDDMRLIEPVNIVGDLNVRFDHVDDPTASQPVAVLAIRQGRQLPTQTCVLPTQSKLLPFCLCNCNVMYGWVRGV
jgi:hypothetical protein